MSAGKLNPNYLLGIHAIKNVGAPVLGEAALLPRELTFSVN